MQTGVGSVFKGTGFSTPTTTSHVIESTDSLLISRRCAQTNNDATKAQLHLTTYYTYSITEFLSRHLADVSMQLQL